VPLHCLCLQPSGPSSRNSLNHWSGEKNGFYRKKKKIRAGRKKGLHKKSEAKNGEELGRRQKLRVSGDQREEVGLGIQRAEVTGEGTGSGMRDLKTRG